MTPEVFDPRDPDACLMCSKPLGDEWVKDVFGFACCPECYWSSPATGAHRSEEDRQAREREVFGRRDEEGDG
ncbi:MAG: hypothetical protein M3R38_01770 [Actinomycetota bacterium]|nr:hypothetical protein [Actinomycetota bacterium]